MRYVLLVSLLLLACTRDDEGSSAMQALPMEVAGTGAGSAAPRAPVAGATAPVVTVVPMRRGCEGDGLDTPCVEEGKQCPVRDLSYGLLCAPTDQGLRWIAATGEEQVPCPEASPKAGSPCPRGQTCSYSPAKCDDVELSSVELVCNPDTARWDVWSLLACKDVPGTAACDPKGDWLVTLMPEEQTTRGNPCGGELPEQIELTIRAADSGVLMSKPLGGALTTDRCQLWLGKFTEWRSTSEYGFVQLDIELALDGSEASGSFRWETRGACIGSRAGLVRATRRH